MTQSNGGLRITPRASKEGKHYYGVVSSEKYDLSGNAISAGVFQVPREGSAVMAVGTDETHYAAFRTVNGNLVFEHRYGTQHSRTEVAYDSTHQRYWRFRQMTAGVIAWETSADGVTWHLQHATEASFPLDSVTIQLGAGTDGAAAAPGTAVFDSVDVGLVIK